MRSVRAADLFAGAGGTTLGLQRAAQDLGFRLDLVAVNHWPIAVQTHRSNFPDVRHFCASLCDVDLATAGGFQLGIDSLDPRQAVPGGLDVLVASPECTHHSNARGGRPKQDQSRATAWCVVRWADALRPHSILVENVPEFRTWGPLGARGQVLRSRRGETYQAFLQALRSLGYDVEDRILCSADYGDPTTRKRLFIQARRGRRRIRWPEPSHAKPGPDGKVPEGLLPWRPAREIIDWSIPGKSIFGRKKPLAKKTIDRIGAGIRRFWGPWAEPFLVMLYGTNDARSVHDPAPTVTSKGQHIGLAQPFLVRYQGGRDSDRRVHDTGEPLPVQDCSNRYGVCSPFLVPHRQFRNMNVDSLDDPLRTILAANGGGALVEPFILPRQGYHDRQGRANRPRSLDEPIHTVVSGNHSGWVVEPFITGLAHLARGEPPRNYGIGFPLPTQTRTRTFGLIAPFLVKYYGTGRPADTGEPIDTVTGKDRFGLVAGTYALDILFRMLKPHELAAAQGFPAGYKFVGNQEDRVRQIGGAVTVNLARHLGRCILSA